MKNELFQILTHYKNKFTSSTNHQNIKIKRKITQNNKNLMNESILKIMQVFKKEMKKIIQKKDVNFDEDIDILLEEDLQELDETIIEENRYFENQELNVIEIKSIRTELMALKSNSRKGSFNCNNKLRLHDDYNISDIDLNLIYSNSSNRKVSVDASFENCWKNCKSNIEEIKMYALKQLDNKTNLTNIKSALKKNDSSIIKNFKRINTFNNNSAMNPISNINGSKKKHDSGYISFNKPMIDKSKYFNHKNRDNNTQNSETNLKELKDKIKKSKSKEKNKKKDYISLSKNNSCNYSQDYLDSEIFMENSCINDIFGIFIKDTSKNIFFPFSKIKNEILKFDDTDENEKIKKYFNKNYKLRFQKNNNLIKSIKREYKLPDEYKFRNFALVLIMDGKLLINMFLVIHENNYRLNISFSNKKFKNVEGFDYLPVIYEEDFFLITILKYIIKGKNTKTSGELFHKCLNMLEIYSSPCIYSQINGTDQYNINQAINYTWYNLDLKKMLKDEQLIFYLASGLRNCKYIVEVNLEDNNLNDDFLKELSKAFSKKNSIQKLGLSYNHFCNEGVKVLCESLHQNDSLLSLGFYHNYIDNVGANAIGEMLKFNKCLLSINIAKNRYDEEGFISIISGLSINTNLKSIGFEYSKIKDESAIYIKEMLICNKSLEELNLSNNNLLDSGFALICEGLIKNEYLNVLGLRKNELTSQSISYLSLILQINKTLQYIYLCDNNIGNENLNDLINSTNRNKMISKIYLQDNKISHDMKDLIRTKYKKVFDI